ncbi:MAG TPA: nucleotidyltransferase family protein, partial [Thermoanaerobaculia bacterium]|nr:nucleotidyltransferase family protein [Thermoanaerobaculia bacterium]
AVRRSLYRSGVECDLLEHHDVNLNGVLPVRFDRIWQEARPVRFRGAEALVMSPEDLLVSLCVNACRKRYFRLKSLFDLAESVRRLEGLDWDRLARRAREHGCAAVAWTALVATRETLGCPLPEGALGGLGVPAVRRRLAGGLLSRFLRTSSLVGEPRAGLSRLLPYAALRPMEAWRAFRLTVTHRPPPHHRAEVAERAAFVGGTPEASAGLSEVPAARQSFRRRAGSSGGAP